MPSIKIMPDGEVRITTEDEAAGSAAVDKAVTAAAAPAEVPLEELPTAWRGVIALENRVTGDGRMFRRNVFSSQTFDRALPLNWSRSNEPEHQGAVTVGGIERVWVTNDEVWGEGPLYLSTEEGVDFATRLHEGHSMGTSVDLDAVSVEIHVLEEIMAAFDEEMEDLFADGAEFVDEDEDEDEDEPENEVVEDPDGSERRVVAKFGSNDELMVITEASLRGTTVVSMAAFADTTIDPVYDYEGQGALVASAATLEEIRTFKSEAFVADLDHPTPLTVDGDRVYGHIALWDSCHTGFRECLQPPPSASNYAYFHVSSVTTEHGNLPVGRLTVDAEHADKKLNAQRAAAHYENTAKCAAFVRAGEDRHGIWVSGVVNPSADTETLETLRTVPISGDWRPLAGSLEMIAALGVNTPGFIVPREALVAGGQAQTIITGLPRAATPEQDERRSFAAQIMRQQRRHRAHVMDKSLRSLRTREVREKAEKVGVL